MMRMDIGTYGAKRQSWKKTSPRDLLKRLMDENGADEAALLKLFEQQVQDDPDYLSPIIEYWFANNYRSLVHRPPSQVEAAERERSVEKVKLVIKARATRMALLEMTMPNGKTLAECTGKDCAKAGGWLSKIAAKIKPTEKVGAVLSEAQVRKLLN